jgi:L-ascorbate metabolism protein UlaG (beta-lactamase superfamily)
MKIHHIRNATCVIETAQHCILVDPMLSKKGELPPFAYLRFKMKRNPTKALPDNAAAVLNKTTHGLITHNQKFALRAFQHTDHLDRRGEDFLRTRNIPVIAHENDAAWLRKTGLNVLVGLNYWQAEPLLGGRLTAVPALHGHGWIHHFMANGAGYYLELAGEPSLYISGDTVYTADVDRVLTQFKPDIAIMASGRAELDIGGPILMSLPELITFAQKAPGHVIANHLEALNHCPATRQELQHALDQNGLSRVVIPLDGETITIEKGG